MFREFDIVFGPVPSRRLGRSLGVNNIPAKTCSYSCVYCQVGRTTELTVERRKFYEPEKVWDEVRKRVSSLKGEKIDYITFVPDGEPTLDLCLGKEISLLKGALTPLAVITNASLLWMEDVRADLLGADYVSLKIDTVNEKVWKIVNRPHPSLKLEKILEGVLEFSKGFRGKIVTETMLVNGIDYRVGFEELGDYLRSFGRLDKVYVSVPTRPPTESWVKPPKEETVNLAFQTLSKKVGEGKVELLVGYEGNMFSFSDNVERSLLSIMAVHPMRRDAVESFLNRTGSSWNLIERLLKEKRVRKLEYEGKEYYMINFSENS
jgi:wyosine [tRNA(Phe)-imidazoG37] synthetase (radical SAM superfamily)